MWSLYSPVNNQRHYLCIGWDHGGYSAVVHVMRVNMIPFLIEYADTQGSLIYPAHPDTHDLSPLPLKRMHARTHTHLFKGLMNIARVTYRSQLVYCRLLTRIYSTHVVTYTNTHRLTVYITL